MGLGRTNSGGGVDVSDTTATASDVWAGKIFYNSIGDETTGTYDGIYKVNGSFTPASSSSSSRNISVPSKPKFVYVWSNTETASEDFLIYIGKTITSANVTKGCSDVVIYYDYVSGGTSSKKLGTSSVGANITATASQFTISLLGGVKFLGGATYNWIAIL